MKNIVCLKHDQSEPTEIDLDVPCTCPLEYEELEDAELNDEELTRYKRFGVG